MRAYTHTVSAHPQLKTSSDLKNRDQLLNHFRSRELIIREFDSWILVYKEAPYSSKDVMIIYSGEDSSKTSFDSLDESERSELWKILSIYSDHLGRVYSDSLDSSESSLIIGINTSIKPGRPGIQSISRPHFHITLIDNGEDIDVTRDGIRRECVGILDGENTLEELRVKFGILPFIREMTLDYITELGDHNISFCENIYLAQLEEELSLESEEDRKYIEKIYQKTNDFLKKYQKINNHFNETLGFSVTFKKSSNGKYKMLIKFSYLDNGNGERGGRGGGFVEATGIGVNRISGDEPTQTCQRFKKAIGSIAA